MNQDIMEQVCVRKQAVCCWNNAVISFDCGNEIVIQGDEEVLTMFISRSLALYVLSN